MKGEMSKEMQLPMKVKSYKEASELLEGVKHFLEAKGHIREAMAIEFSACSHQADHPSSILGSAMRPIAYLHQLAQAVGHVETHNHAYTPIAWTCGWRYAIMPQTTSNYITRSTRPSRFFSRALKNIRRPEYEAIFSFELTMQLYYMAISFTYFY